MMHQQTSPKQPTETDLHEAQKYDTGNGNENKEDVSLSNFDISVINKDLGQKSKHE